MRKAKHLVERGEHLDDAASSTIGPSRLPNAMSAADKIGVTSLSRSAPSLGGIRVSLGNGDPSIMSPTAAIVIEAVLPGVGSAITAAGGSSLLTTFGWQAIIATDPNTRIAGKTNLRNIIIVR